MFHGEQIQDKINKLHETALRIVYNDTRHLKNYWLKIKLSSSKYSILAIKKYKAVNSLPVGNLTKILARNNRNKSELTASSVNTIFKG